MLILITGLCACKNDPENIAVVNEQEVFKNFEMTKEANARIESRKKKGIEKIDSLQTVLALVKMTNEDQQKIQSLILETRENVRADLSALSEKEFTMVWNRINTHSAEYAKENGYTVLMGRRPEGIWYNSDGADITKELIVYLNSKYNNQ